MFKNVQSWVIGLTSLFSLIVLTALAIRSDLIILDPKGPVGAIQKDLIIYSIYFMLAILIVVYALFTFIVTKYRDRKNFDKNEYKPDMHGSTKLEIIWTLIPIIIVTALSIPNAKALYELKKPPKSTADKEPIVIHATAVDWKWIFSYPDNNIETVNYVNVPEDYPILFKVTAADSMASFWIPQLGGQIYGMPGMVNELYLQADDPGVYKGRNSNFTGVGMTNQIFRFVALAEEDYQDWLKKTKKNAPELDVGTYEKLMLPETVGEMTFSSTHLEFIDHSKNSEYALNIREKYGVEVKGIRVKADSSEEDENEATISSHH
ncbi:cytochrome aa3 quinol oxidase subunit II [Cohnella sp. CIP 111063]|uniref:cytochrome aa3 quinol oxidase subunit II n=1 Tax=unclassified Cohnella TaxID=2636738 RepID=UPI000B8C4D31|nr:MULTISPECIES: cytochrome aa3 quinol oxidase subunit II [unclassified Cohnella]OXS54905.1 cytochrome aa3 quinol oxidase subunit II [Cohnella sp. CIP 111063]PRX65055.1 cytochrome aa3 quinol oxidase subunit 2 [Cohnella sp. SGD-V74]